jgi:hypothetical protein
VRPSGEPDKVTSTFPYRKREKKPLSLYSDKEADPTTPRRDGLYYVNTCFCWTGIATTTTSPTTFKATVAAATANVSNRVFQRSGITKHVGTFFLIRRGRRAKLPLLKLPAPPSGGNIATRKVVVTQPVAVNPTWVFPSPLTLVGSQMMRLGHPKTSVSRRS